MKRFNRRIEKKVRGKLIKLTEDYKNAETKLIAAIDYWVALPKEPPFVVQREHIIEAGDKLSDAADRFIRFFSDAAPDSYTPPQISTNYIFAEGGRGSRDEYR